jgi:selenide,water dikinase
MREANCSILGGHSVADEEIKFGYAVTGTDPPGAVKPNAGARAGRASDVHQADRHRSDRDRVEARACVGGACRGAIQSMLTLNRRACERMLRFDVHGCTDVSGFGLIGHAREMALASNVTLEIEESNPLSARRARLSPPGGAAGRSEKQPRFAECVVSRETDMSVEAESCCTTRRLRAGC